MKNTDRKLFFIGLDSDGTAFDSMNIKHKKAFLPALIRVWSLENHAETVCRIGENINLYSNTRGIDRFRGLLLLFQQLEEAGVPVPDYSDLAAYINATEKLSNFTLENYIARCGSTFLKQVLRWSREADVIFSRETAKIMPFTAVSAVLAKAKEKADIAVISSASRVGLIADWMRGGLDVYVNEICGQENGSKQEQLFTIINGHYANRCLVIGDTLLDYEAAKSVNAFFYPIIPQREEESWERLLQTELDLFLNDKFDDWKQQQLLQEFQKTLQP